MPAVEIVLPLMEGTVGSLVGGKQHVAEWLKECKQIMLSGSNRLQTDWEFLGLPDIDESGAAAMIEAATTTVYGLLVGQSSSGAGGDFVAILDDAAGGYTFDGTAALDNTFRAVHYIPAAATDAVEELRGFVYPAGISITNDVMVVSDGTGGTNPGTDHMRAWILYRTVAI